MASHYLANEYPDESIRSQTRPPTIDQIQEYIETDELGWRPEQDPLTELSTYISTVKFDLHYNYGDPTKQLMKTVESNLENHLPTIAFIDPVRLRDGKKRDEGPLHAVVICGQDGGNSVICDPWRQGTDQVENNKLKDAWDPDYNQLIDIALSAEGADAGGNQ